MPIIKRSSWGFQNNPNLPSLDDFEPSYCNWKKIKVFQNWFDIWFWKAVCEPLCFWLFYQSNFVQTLQVGGVLESSGSPLDDGHWDFDNCSKMAEIVEVVMGTFSTEIIFLSFCHFSKEGCQLHLQFSQPFLHQFSKYLCPSSRGDPQVSKTPPEVIFLIRIGRQNSKNKVAPKIENQKYFRKTLSSLEHHNLASNSQIEQEGGVFELSRPPLEDRHRDFSN